MPTQKNYDPAYTEAFKNNFIAHLKNTNFAPGTENQPRELIEQAKGNIAKLSRIFDQLPLPVLDDTSFRQAISEAGNIDAFMRPILNDITQVLLNPDKTRVQDNVIAAIGTKDYAEIVGGEVNADGKVVPKSGDEERFAQEEAEVARLMTASIIVSYSLRVSDYVLSDEAKAMQKQCDDLFQAGNRLKSTLASQQLEGLRIDPVTFDPKAADMLIKTHESAIQSDTDSSALLNLYKQCESLRQAGKLEIDHQTQEFTSTIIAPLDIMATLFTMKTLEEPAPKPSLEEVKQKVAALEGLVDAAIKELKDAAAQYRQEHNIPNDTKVPALDNPIESAYRLKNKLEEISDVEEIFPDASDDTKRDKIEKIYNNAINQFSTDVQQDVLKAKPPAPLMSVVLRLLRSIFTLSFSLTTESEKADQRRFEQESKIIEDISALKSKLPQDPSPEVQSPTQSEDLTASMENPDPDSSATSSHTI
ncbi:hypothetical protein [Legionella bononiensis]|uniref:Coiled-coil protein n=1 Tax=Legionella bononiensis TaxID=2793102 RepID=A0ABS1WB63_9GAMM|nr:hypothetical protein [Legionella bononiensis]MBL7480178.1 hypothetical protein [Legionella bononiensis]MBL7526591.1 hypothetical protein [Legionella bononiensis]MBL7562915.1 hypothetical protein [Legionella bononiensis]